MDSMSSKTCNGISYFQLIWRIFGLGSWAWKTAPKDLPVEIRANLGWNFKFSFFYILIPYYQISISCFWIDIDIQTLPFHVLLKMLIPYSRFSYLHFMFSWRYWFHMEDSQQKITRIFSFVRTRSFRQLLTSSISNILKFPEIMFVKAIWDSLGFVKISWCLQRYIILVLGVMVTSARSENLQNEVFSSFPKTKPKSY